MTVVLADTHRGGGVQAGSHTPGWADRQQHTPPQGSTRHRTSPPATDMTTQDGREAGWCKESRDDAKTGTPQHPPLPPFNTATNQTEGGRQHTDGKVTITAPALPSPCHPTSSRHPTIHDGPTHHHDEGGTDRGYPTTRTARTHTLPALHTQQRTVHDMTAVLTSTALG